jgi:hypothetical protein
LISHLRIEETHLEELQGQFVLRNLVVYALLLCGNLYIEHRQTHTDLLTAKAILRNALDTGIGVLGEPLLAILSGDAELAMELTAKHIENAKEHMIGRMYHG